MTFALHVLPSIALFMVVAVSALPAISQARMLLLGASASYTSGMFLPVWLYGETVPDTVFLLVGGGAGSLVGALLALVCRKLRGDYFALATLCFAELLRLVLLINPPFPGPQGIPGVPRGTILSVPLESAGAMAGAALALLFLASIATAFSMRSPWGAGLQASSDHELSARTSGVAVDKLRASALVYAGLWGGLAGALAVRYLSLADVEAFALTESVMVLVVALLAARNSIARCLAVSCVVGLGSELLRFFATGALRQIVFGTTLFILAFIVRGSLGQAEKETGAR
jgi:branched-chain amino acid transport system permease protein